LCDGYDYDVQGTAGEAEAGGVNGDWVGRRLGLTAWAQASDAQFTDACNRWSVRLKEKSEECSKLLIEQVMWRWAVREK
jgi:hypothetical protein